MVSFRRLPPKAGLNPPVKQATPISAAARLEQIADLVGVPVETLIEGAAPSSFGSTAELLEIWDQLPTDADREKLLAFARALLKA